LPNYPHILIATLGGQPQVVTFTLDFLLQRGFPISAVVVLHPEASEPRLQHALACLNAEFASDYYHVKVPEGKIRFRSYTLEQNGRTIDDITNDADADGTLEAIHGLISNLKRQGSHIHLSVTGGRRMMALLAISVASFNFDRHDHIWHINTPEHIKKQVDEGKQMHVPADAGVKLIEGPFIALGAYFHPSSPSFRTTQEEQLLQLDAQERAKCREVVRAATPSQLRVLQAFASGLTPQEVAQALGVTLVTVNAHKTALLSLCRDAWGLPPDRRLDYNFLHVKFSGYFGDEAALEKLTAQ
jgi:CRISPR-associated protein Csx14